MSLFLIVYDRSSGATDLRGTYPQDQASEAVRDRFALERELAASKDADRSDTEVVILSGESIDEVKRTHARYFGSVQDLLAVPDSLVGPAPDCDNGPAARPADR